MASHNNSAPRLTALSPLDGRYANQTAELREYFSEYALLRVRVEVEVEWFIYMSECGAFKEIPKFTAADKKFLRNLVKNFSIKHAARIKKIETTTAHDVKAVEYFIREYIKSRARLAGVSEFIHFACTSEDINNLAYGLLLKRMRDDLYLPQVKKLIALLDKLSHRYAAQAMLARTHGQPASPTTLGKEFKNVVARLKYAAAALAAVQIFGKFNGASGNFNAHLVAYPNVQWEKISREFVKHLGLVYQAYSTQIEPHDYIAQLSAAMQLLNTILIDFARDVWGYIALGYFRQQVRRGEIGSSAMPHKVNPINFENAEGNLGIANALFIHFATKLPISRWQRDLTDSTVLRNLGTAFGHSLLALDSTENGIKRIAADANRINQDLAQSWEVIAEAVQTVMRKHKIKNSYEKLKDFSRGQQITYKSLYKFISELDIPAADKNRLLELTPSSYIGIADKLARKK